jgi:hypothetical protein
VRGRIAIFGPIGATATSLDLGSNPRPPPYDHGVRLRRALLLFAIVLGLAAVAASISRPGDVAERPREGPGRERSPVLGAQPPRLEPGATVRFDASRPSKKRLTAGQATAIVVAVHEPGLVEIPRLGLSAPAAPLTPARFDVLERRPDRYPIVFTPADGDDSRAAGTLAIAPPGA